MALTDVRFGRNTEAQTDKYVGTRLEIQISMQVVTWSPDGCALWQNAHSERGASLCTFRFKKQHEAESGYVAYHREQNVHEWNFIGFGGTGARAEGFVLLVGMRPPLPENWQTGG